MRLLLIPGALTLALGTIATAAGPHAGGEGTGDEVLRLTWRGAETLDWAIHQHGALATFLGLAAVGVWFLVRVRGMDAATQNAMTAVCVLLACQGFVGATQYALELPAEIVWFHVVLSALTWIALLVAAAAAGRIADRAAPVPLAGRAGRARARRQPVRALVTGGAGFIGSHLVDVLLAAGDEVTVVDHLNRTVNLSGAVAGVALAGPRRRDRRGRRCCPMFAAARPEAVYHLAAQIDVRRSVDDPSTDAHQNVGGTAAVLEAARHAGARRVVLASTAGVYGDPATLPVAEDTPIAPLSPYGASKAAAESYLSLFSRLYGISTLSLRMSNVYGPRQNPHGEAGVIAIFAAAAAEGRPVTIFGDGSQTRDFVYVEDVVQAFAAAGRTDERGAINVSTGAETSLLDLASTLGLSTVPRPGTPRRDQPLEPRSRLRRLTAGLAGEHAARRGPAAHDRRVRLITPARPRAGGPCGRRRRSRARRRASG